MSKLQIKATIDSVSEASLYNALIALPERKRARYLVYRALFGEERTALMGGMAVAGTNFAPADIKRGAPTSMSGAPVPMLSPTGSLSDGAFGELLAGAVGMEHEAA